MSRVTEWPPARRFGFPRVSGDEPHVQKIKATLPMFSPRERG